MVQRPFGRQSSIRATESPLRFVVRVLGFGLLLIYLNIYWIVASEHRVIGEVTIFSFFPQVPAGVCPYALVETLPTVFQCGFPVSISDLKLFIGGPSVRFGRVGLAALGRHVIALPADPLR